MSLSVFLSLLSTPTLKSLLSKPQHAHELVVLGDVLLAQLLVLGRGGLRLEPLFVPRSLLGGLES